MNAVVVSTIEINSLTVLEYQSYFLRSGISAVVNVVPALVPLPVYGPEP